MTLTSFFTRKMITTILVRFLINTTLGSIVACFLYRTQHDSFLILFLESQIYTHSVSSMAFISRYFLRSVLTPRFSTARFVIFSAVIFFFAACGVFIGAVVNNILFSTNGELFGVDLVGILIPSLLITAVFIAFYTVLDRFREKQKNLEHDLGKFVRAQETGSDKYFSLKDGDIHRMIKYADLIYLSSSGRVSVVHTKDKDYEVRELLGDMEKILPQNIFLRIHKQFVVNIRFISGLRYYEGGRYNLYLTDDDETVLPVGKSFTANVRKCMKIMM